MIVKIGVGRFRLWEGCSFGGLKNVQVTVGLDPKSPFIASHC